MTQVQANSTSEAVTASGVTAQDDDQRRRIERGTSGDGERGTARDSEQDADRDWDPRAAAAAAAPTDRDVEIVEVSARDGLQNDPAHLSTTVKIELINRCVRAGARRIEVASFVNPKRVPQMADAEAVIAALSTAGSPLRERPSERPSERPKWIGLVLNQRGFERARETALDEINLVVMVTDTFSMRNQGMGTEAAIAAVEHIAPLARGAGLTISVAMSASFGCPFEGEVPVQRVAEIAARLATTCVDEIALADTIGVAVPRDVIRRTAAVRDAVGPSIKLRAHFHNTRNTGYVSALAAFEAGITVLDASLGGIGGCPFAPRATGNIATEDLVFALERSGVHTGFDLDELIRASDWLGTQLGRPTPALVSKAGPFPPR